MRHDRPFRVKFWFRCYWIVLGILGVSLPRAARAGGSFAYAAPWWQQDTSFVSATDVRYVLGLDAAFIIDAAQIPAFPDIGSPVREPPDLSKDPFKFTYSGTGLGPTTVTVPLLVTGGLFVRTPQDKWFTASGTVAVTVPRSALPLQIVHSNCCRATALADGNGSMPYTVSMVIPATAGVTASPRAGNSARFYSQSGRSFSIPLQDFVSPAGQQFRFASSAESGLATPTPTGLTLSSSGLLSWTPTTAGLFATQIVITNSNGTSIADDFIIEVDSPQTTTSFAQGFCGSQQLIDIGKQTTFDVTATSPQPNDTVAIATTALEAGMMFSNVTSGATSTYRFSFTPTPSEDRATSVCFMANGAAGPSIGQCCVSLVPAVHRAVPVANPASWSILALGLLTLALIRLHRGGPSSHDRTV
jgi:hypothetical protein